MDIPEQLSNELLEAYIRVSMKLWNERTVKYMPYNEALVCHLLSVQKSLHSDMPYLTLMQLCEATGILKSQMNKTLNSLENQGLITRERSTSDKRVVYITMCEDNLGIYLNEQKNISMIVNRIIEKLGIERSYEAISIFNDIASEISVINDERK